MFVKDVIEVNSKKINENLHSEYFYDRQIVDRGENIASLPLGAAACVADLAYGILSLPAAVFTGFCHETVREEPIKRISNLGMLPAFVADHVIRFLNPQEEIIAYPFNEGVERNLFFSEKLTDFFTSHQSLLNDESWVNRNIIAKLHVLPMIAVATAMTIAEFVLGIFATVAAIVTLGRFPEINGFSLNEFAVGLLTVPVDFFMVLGHCTVTLLKFPA